ncbi:hypothetical protein HY546_02630, partial [archaeon]|nr:hypothetical protein [archaeon]
DWRRLGYPLKALFLIEAGKLDEESFSKVRNYIGNESSFISSGTLSGDYDLFVIGKFRSQEEAMEKSTKLRAFLGKETDLRTFRTYNVWQSIKETIPTFKP